MFGSYGSTGHLWASDTSSKQYSVVHSTNSRNTLLYHDELTGFNPLHYLHDAQTVRILASGSPFKLAPETV